MHEECYLGDNINAIFNGETISLNNESDEIVLTGYTMRALLDFMNRLGVIKL